jgi:ketopantoate reductase
MTKVDDENAWSVALAYAREAIAVAGAIGVELDVGDPIARLRRRSDEPTPVDDTVVAIVKARESKFD